MKKNENQFGHDIRREEEKGEKEKGYKNRKKFRFTLLLRNITILRASDTGRIRISPMRGHFLLSTVLMEICFDTLGK